MTGSNISHRRLTLRPMHPPCVLSTRTLDCSERFLNLPTQLAVGLYQTLLRDVDAACAAVRCSRKPPATGHAT
jgi:hypothetical protein